MAAHAIPGRAGPNRPGTVVRVAIALIALATAGGISLRAGTNPPAETVAAPEVVINTRVATIGELDLYPRIFTDGAGRFCVLHVEGLALRALHSADDGETFVDRFLVGGPESPVSSFAAARAPTGEILVAVRIGDSDGEYRVRFTRSLDMGSSFEGVAAVSELSAGSVQIASGSEGLVAIVTGGSLTTSTDGGVSWGPTLETGLRTPRLAIEPQSNTILLADIHLGSPTIARSTDLGASVEPPVVVPVLADRHLSIAPAADGGVLVAYQNENYPAEQNVVVRSSDLGATFDEVLAEDHGIRLEDDPQFGVAPSSAMVIVGHVDDWGNLDVFVSGDHGRTFGPRQRLVATTAVQIDPDDLRIVATPDGTWVVAWRDGRDPEARAIYARSSTDGGSTWGPERMLHDPAAAIGGRSGFDLLASGADHLVHVFADARAEAAGWDMDLVWNRGPAATLTFTAETPIDTDRGLAGPAAGRPFPQVATDGESRVYHAFTARDDPRETHLFVTSSVDRGRTLSPPVKVSDAAVASSFSWIQLAAVPDGSVYVLYFSVVPSSTLQGTGELRLARSADFGATWSEQVLDAGELHTFKAALAAQPDGRVQVAWGRASPVRLMFARSTDGAQSLDVSVMADGQFFDMFLPGLCAAEEHVVLTWPQSGLHFAAVSADGGATFGAPVDITFPGGLSRQSAVVCRPGGEALVAWARSALYLARFDGSGWAPTERIELDVDDHLPDLAYSTPDHQQVILAVEGNDGTIRVVRSMDGGATFDVHHPMDAGAANPDGDSSWPALATDGWGNVWLTWEEREAGSADSVVFRRSADGGTTFGPLRRFDRATRGLFSDHLPRLAALDEVVFVTWVGSRQSLSASDVLLNTDDLRDQDRDGIEGDADCDDFDGTTYPGAEQACDGVDNTCGGSVPDDESDPDGDALLTCTDNCPADANPDQADRDLDGAGNACDCAPADAGSFAVPTEIADLRLNSGVSAWGSLVAIAGPAVRYDVIRGDLTVLPVGSGSEACHAAGLETATAPTGPDPGPGEAVFFLVRAGNTCGQSGLGTGAAGDRQTGACD